MKVLLFAILTAVVSGGKILKQELVEICMEKEDVAREESRFLEPYFKHEMDGIPPHLECYVGCLAYYHGYLNEDGINKTAVHIRSDELNVSQDFRDNVIACFDSLVVGTLCETGHKMAICAKDHGLKEFID